MHPYPTSRQICFAQRRTTRFPPRNPHETPSLPLDARRRARRTFAGSYRERGGRVSTARAPASEASPRTRHDLERRRAARGESFGVATLELLLRRSLVAPARAVPAPQA